MSKRTQDFQKQEAKRSLWDMDGEHVQKRYRNKAKARSKDRRLVDELTEEILEEHPWLTHLDDNPTPLKI